MDNKKEISVPKCYISQSAGNPRCQLYSVKFADGLSGCLVSQDGRYLPGTTFNNKGEYLPWCRTVDEAITVLYERLALLRDHPEEAEAARKAARDRIDAKNNALKAAALFQFDDKAKIAVYREKDINYEIIPWGMCGASGNSTSSTHLPIFEQKKYYLKAEDGVHAFTPKESFFGFHLLLGNDIEYNTVKVATRCTIDGVDGDCLLVADYAQSADADRLEDMSPYDDLGFAHIWSDCPHFHPTEEDAANGGKFCSPRLRRIARGGDKVVYEQKN